MCEPSVYMCGSNVLSDVPLLMQRFSTSDDTLYVVLQHVVVLDMVWFD